ncbi:MAG: CerR family C-terminal domain-containing protein [Proteobacteria bacterium]|jgi:AcrR family transcriptional regulator|nr:CerR family C-terminal domain-containing protein [Pseudomonadota bacterium]
MAEDNSTRERLLKEARTVFAELGLKNATIRDICTRAEANVAAVSYHFGGKERLYIAVLRDYIERENRRHPRDQGVTPESPPQERLRVYVRSILLQTLDGGDAADERLSRQLTQEFIEPSQHFGEIFEQFCRPAHRLLLDIVGKLLPEADDLTVSRCASSIFGQCVLFDFAKEALSRMSPESALKPSNVEQITEFIMQFSLGGISRLRAAQAQLRPPVTPSPMRSEGDT